MKMYEMLELSGLYESIKNIKLPLKVSYKFSLLMNEVERELKFYQDKMGEIIDEFAQRDVNGEYVISEDKTSIAIVPERINECNTRIEELRNLEVSVPNVKFNLDELEFLELSIAEMGCLLPLIEE